MIRDWLKAGVFEAGKGFAPTKEGTPQGGIISPCLLNAALHGLEEAAGVTYVASGKHAGETRRDSPALVRYADDLVALCHSKEQAEQVKARLAGWLAPRGLAFNEDKTRVVHLGEGFDFLGFTVRRFPSRRGGKLIIKPSAAAVRRFKRRLATEFRSLRGANAAAVLARIAPVTRGWGAFYRTVVSSRVFSGLDDYLWKLCCKWATWSHPKKPKPWIAGRYFGRFHPGRADRWVSGDRASGAYLPRLAWMKIERHQMVAGTASPDDPSLAAYWAHRRRRARPPTGDGTLRLLRKQRGRCPLCGDYLLHADDEPRDPGEWERWLTATRKAITCKAVAATGSGSTPYDQRRLIHAYCWRRATGARTATELLHL